MAKRMTIAEFKEKANKKFKGKFNYDKVNFIHSQEAVPIICPIHSEFLQIPFLHLKSKFGCPRCSRVGKKTTYDFIKEAQKVHGIKYSYKKSTYKGRKQKLLITCPVHGEFERTPIAHINRKQGCPICSGRTIMYKNLFIRRSLEIHGNKFLYDKVVYKNTHTKVELICKVKEHGKFFVLPANHLKKKSPQGCPICGRKKSADAKSMTTEEFIAKAKQRHGEKFTYENTVYTRSNRKVKINCREHGEFEQQANSHLLGNGCPVCGKLKNHTSTRKTTSKFIEEAKKIHGDKYDYSKVKYENTHSKVCLICKVEGHGEFEQEPNSHLRGSGCPKCFGKTNLSTEKFIEKARIVHVSKYDYSKVDYKSTHQKVLITCSIHGDFEQTPGSHLNGSGCPNCGGTIKMTYDYFIKKAKEKHGNTYDYSKVKFNSRNNEVTIICPIHGEFRQKPRNHIRSGCPHCGGSHKLNTDVFIEKARIVHVDFYSYENAFYKNSSTKIEINCPYHGSFWQLPPSHLKGHGCKVCRNSRGEFKIEKYLKELRQVSFENQYTFSDCKNIFPLPFDFAIFLGDKIGLIEFNGEQHYSKVDFGHKKESRSDLENIQLRDGIKKEYCNNNNYQLLIIKYDQIENIKQLVDDFISKIKNSENSFA